MMLGRRNLAWVSPLLLQLCSLSPAHSSNVQNHALILSLLDEPLIFKHRHYICADTFQSESGSASIELHDVPDAHHHLEFASNRDSAFSVKVTTNEHRPTRFINSGSVEGQSVLDHGRARYGNLVPNTSDKETVVNLAKMTSDAYLMNPHEPDWFNTSFGFNFTCRFGWNGDGLRGHVFTTENNKTVIVAFKGTSIDFSSNSTQRDRFNDSHGYSPVCNCSTGYYQCDSKCLTEALLQNDTYYSTALKVTESIMEKYPQATFWTVGHSLGGSLASLVGHTLNIPAITFEAPPERLPAQRLGILPENRSGILRTKAFIRHFGNTADPVFMGSCNGFFSLCSLWGFDFESQCFSGKRCVYDTVKDKGWRSNIWNHRINHVIENVLKAYETVPSCEVDTECEDCYNWKFGG